MLSLSLASSWGAGDVKVDSNIYGDILSHYVPSDAHCDPVAGISGNDPTFFSSIVVKHT